MLGIVEATKKGLTAFGPSATSAIWLRSVSGVPATAQPKVTPVRSATGSSSRPASATASRAATIASCEKRAVRWARFGPRCSTGSNPLTSPAIRVGSSLASNWVIGPTPDSPASSARQVDGASRPTGVSAPSPVTTGSRAPFNAPEPCSSAAIIAIRPHGPAGNPSKGAPTPSDRGYSRGRSGVTGHCRVPVLIRFGCASLRPGGKIPAPRRNTGPQLEVPRAPRPDPRLAGAGHDADRRPHRRPPRPLDDRRADRARHRRRADPGRLPGAGRGLPPESRGPVGRLLRNDPLLHDRPRLAGQPTGDADRPEVLPAPPGRAAARRPRRARDRPRRRERDAADHRPAEAPGRRHGADRRHPLAVDLGAADRRPVRDRPDRGRGRG